MGNKSSENLKRGIILVFIANLINLVISLLNGFILPKYLSINTYADIKTFQLYSNYIGVLALGYADGLYLKYGGHSLNSISNEEMNICRSNLILSQSIMTILFVIAGFVSKDQVLLIAGLTIVPVNIAHVFKNILQATGEFKAYSRILNYSSVLTFVGTMILLFGVKTDISLLYIAIMAIVTVFVWGLLEYKLYTVYHFKFGFIPSFKNFVDNVKSGFVLMLGNFSSILMTSIDRWFVKFLLSTADFAYYSFVVSTEHLITIFINPIVTTMYNYICVSSDYNAIKRIKRMCLVFSLFLVSSAFPAKFILEVYLTKYLKSQYVLFILFSTEIFFMLIKGIYVNIYKARKRQDLYFKQLVFSIVIGTVLNAVFYIIFHSNEGIAFATLISVICWYIICCLSVKEVKPDWREILILVITIPTYIVCGFFLPSVLGFIAYILTVIVLAFLLMREETVDIIKMSVDMVSKKLIKR